jgi:uncharacterized membrane protein YbhN (UPF0104 family)
VRQKSRRIVVFIIKFFIAVFSFFYIYFNLSRVGWHDVNILFENGLDIFLLIPVLILMPVNWFIESVKWKFLLSKIQKIKFIYSVKAVYTGIAFAIFTPNRIGELAGRIFVLETDNRIKGIFSTAVGSLAQMCITVIFGFVGGIFLFRLYPDKISGLNNDHILLIQITGLFIVLLFPVFFFSLKTLFRFIQRFKLPDKLLKTVEVIAGYSKRELIIVLLLSFLRYSVFVFQLYLLMVLFDVGILFHEALICISLTYFVSSVIPSFTLAEIGIRGSAALFFTGLFIHNEIAVISATISVWIINLAIPAMIGAILFLRTKI